MTTTISAQRLRRGLPRTMQGESWPPVDSPPLDPFPVEAPSAVTTTVFPLDDTVDIEPTTTVATPVTIAEPSNTEKIQLRYGLPRIPGGEAWPPKHLAIKRVVPQLAAPVSEAITPDIRPASQPAHNNPSTTAAFTLRQGLPRAPGQALWPEINEVHVEIPIMDNIAAPELVKTPTSPVVAEPTIATKADKPEATRYGPFTLAQWVGGSILGVLSLIAIAAIMVLGVRWFINTGMGSRFIETYDGAAPMPENAPVGFPAWLAWSHFFNLFLMVLIIRSGLQVRNERRPSAYWRPRSGSRGKISLTTWFHQSLDLLWVINGAVFAILIFATGQWMRIVPTSWEVIPNAVSAALQYLSLDWPTENGWIHYNGLQQLSYFTTVFVAAPLAVATGIRMSGLWPSKMKKISAIYPVEVARKLHFPVMLYFVFFIFTHVLLVFATGALRNLNHMFAAQGSTDTATYAANWTGFWLFVLGMVVIVAAWVAARPILLTPVARLFGTVTAR